MPSLNVPAEQGEKYLLKLVGVREFYNITRAKIVSALNCAIVMAVCATATFAVDTTLNYTSVEAQPIETTMQTVEVTITVVSYPEGFDPEHPEDYDPTQNAVASSESSIDMTSESTAARFRFLVQNTITR